MYSLLREAPGGEEMNSWLFSLNENPKMQISLKGRCEEVSWLVRLLVDTSEDLSKVENVLGTLRII